MSVTAVISFGGGRKGSFTSVTAGNQQGATPATTSASQDKGVASLSETLQSKLKLLPATPPAPPSAAHQAPPNLSASSIGGALISPAVLSGTGSFLWVATLNNQWFSLGYALLAGLSFINELRVSDKTENKSEASKKVGKGVVAFFDEQVRLPGVCVSANGVGFLMTMGLGVYNLDPLITFASVIFATAEFASASICNSDVARLPREKLSIEKQGRAIWENVPPQVRTYLKNPGALFPIGNAIIYGRALVESVGSLGTVTPLQTTFMVCGGALMTLAGVVGLKPLIARNSDASKDTSASAAAKRNPSVAQIVASGLANGMIGDVMISAGLESGSMLSVFTGAASLFWCAGNLRMALKLSKLRPKADDAWARFVVDKVIVRIEERLNDFNQAQTKGESRSGVLAPSDEQQKNKYDFLQKLVEEHKTYKPSQRNRHPQSELHRIIKGFIVNFISQSESDLQPLNIQHGRNPEALEYWNSLDPKALENARLPGMFHAAASYNHLKREHPGRGESSRKFHAIGEVLRVSIDIFKEEHAKLNLSEKTRASIYNDHEAVIRLASEMRT